MEEKTTKKNNRTTEAHHVHGRTSSHGSGKHRARARRAIRDRWASCSRQERKRSDQEGPLSAQRSAPGQAFTGLSASSQPRQPGRTGSWGQLAAGKWGSASCAQATAGSWVRFSIFHSSLLRPTDHRLRFSATPSSLNRTGVARPPQHPRHQRASRQDLKRV